MRKNRTHTACGIVFLIVGIFQQNLLPVSAKRPFGWTTSFRRQQQRNTFSSDESSNSFSYNVSVFPSGLSRAVSAMLVSRGGSMRGLGWHWAQRWKAPSRQYRQMLTEQSDLLERQLRASREELAQLRKHYKELQTAKLDKTDEKSSAEQLKEVSLQMLELQEENKRLESMKADLEKMLIVEQRKRKTLEEKLEQLNKSSGDMKEKYERQLTKLRAELEEQASRQLEELKKMMETRMEEALAKANKEAEREREKAVRDAEQRFRQRAGEQLEEERRKAEEAVEREKVKMRKLIKALAEREKKLLSQSEREKENRSKTSTSSGNKKSSKQQTTSGATVRGPRRS